MGKALVGQAHVHATSAAFDRNHSLNRSSSAGSMAQSSGTSARADVGTVSAALAEPQRPTSPGKRRAGDMTETRSDHPVIKQRRRGCLDLKALVLDEAAKADIMRMYVCDKFAASTEASRASHLETWIRFLHAWHGAPVNVVPVEVADIAAVGALMKEGGYRSFTQYITRVRDLHIKHGFEWTAQHVLEANQGIRSVTRGQGPPRQSAPLPVDEVRALDIGHEALVAGGLVDAGNSFVLGSAFLLREVELSFARRRHLTLDTHAHTVTLELPVSKTDACAIGCSRTWGCVCLRDQPGVDTAMACPYHAACRHIEALRGMSNGGAGIGQDVGENAALFPTSAGATVTKDAVVRTIEALGDRLGEPRFEHDGTRRFGGHSLRVSGARWLASKGLPAEKISSLARWESQIVLRYIGDAALSDLTAHCVRLTQRRGAALPEVTEVNFDQIRDEAHLRCSSGDQAFQDSLRDECLELRDAVTRISAELEAIAEQSKSTSHDIGLRKASDNANAEALVEVRGLVDGLLRHQEAQIRPQYVLNPITATLHAVAGDLQTTSSEDWRTVCNWRFARARSYRFVAEGHVAVLKHCHRCGLKPI